MSKKPIDYGGSAFPIPTEYMTTEHTGMTLRDWFAGQALSSLRIGDWTACKDGAKYCYDYADAMIAARKENP